MAAIVSRPGEMPDGWHVVHRVPVGEGGSDIDQLLVGPGGVFTSNTKLHPGSRVWLEGHTLVVDGERTDYLLAARFEAARAAKLLSLACSLEIHVEPVLIVSAGDLAVKGRPEGVRVSAPNDSVEWLSRLAARLSTETVAAVFEHAQRRSTWTLQAVQL